MADLGGKCYGDLPRSSSEASTSTLSQGGVTHMRAVFPMFREETAGVICRQPPPTALGVYVSVSPPHSEVKPRAICKNTHNGLEVGHGDGHASQLCLSGESDQHHPCGVCDPWGAASLPPCCSKLRFYVPMPLDWCLFAPEHWLLGCKGTPAFPGSWIQG